MQITPQQTIHYLTKSRSLLTELTSDKADEKLGTIAKYGIGENVVRLIQLHIKELDNYIFSLKRFESDRESLRKGNMPNRDNQADGIKS